MIKFDRVSKSFGNNKILREVSFEVGGGEFVCLVGASGAGKSTIIHLLLGADKPDEGAISIDHYEISKMTGDQLQEYRRRVGVVFQDYKLLPNKTVSENIGFALEVLGYDKSHIDKRTKEVIAMVGLNRRTHALPKELSGGEKQRTSLARALIHAPKLLIADEPTGNLDPDNTDELIKLLLKINKAGTTVILATHDDRIVDTIKKRVIKLKAGKKIMDKENSTYNA